MRSNPITTRTRLALFSLIAGYVASALSGASAGQAAFSGLAGSWSGTGSISLADGSRERIRCKASYLVSQAEGRLQQSLKCASDSYRFDLMTDLISQQQRVAGSWSESSRGIGGTIVGKESGGAITAVVDAPGFSARLSLTVRGDSQSVSIASDGEIRSVTIGLRRN